MLTIRLQRVGKRNFATFRIVVTEHTRAPQSGKYVEMVGWWNPHTDQAEINKERASYWLSVGAQPTDVVHNLFVDAGIVEGKKRNVLPKKHPQGTSASQEGGKESAEGTSEESAAPATEGEAASEAQGEAKTQETA